MITDVYAWPNGCNEPGRMSKLKAVITMLVLGSSSVAAAAPRSPYADAQSSWRDRDLGRSWRDRSQGDHRDSRFRASGYDHGDRARRYHRRDRGYGDDFGPRRYRATWVTLSSPLGLAHGRDAIEVGIRGTFTQLRFQTAGGRSYLDRVIVHFRDGSRQVANVDRVLHERDRRFDLPLVGNNRRIDRIEMLGDSNRRGAIQVFGI